MKATQALPENYSLAWSLDLKHNLRLNIILQLTGLAWMAVSGWLLGFCILWLRPEVKQSLPGAGFQVNLLGGLVVLLLVMAVAISLHELVHGLFFWLFSKRRPLFGLGSGYAYAAMPDWYFPKMQYLVIGLAPLLVLTGLGLAASLIVPLAGLGALFAGLVINAGGAIGDLYVCWRIAREDPQVWVRDTGDGFQLYRRVDG
ncbi:MAG TPA: DUF3267 domain-containing protein [Anaerolineales bacterium]|jgi:hypothetical protein